MSRRIFKLLHLWLSVPLGLIIVLMCLSGAVLLFERDFGHIGQAEVNGNGNNPLPVDSILFSANSYLDGENSIVGLTTYPDPNHAYKVMLAKPAMAALWVNQYTGEVIGKYERAQIFKIASAAHRRLFGKSKADGGYGAKTGKFIVGVTSIGLFLIIITGFVIWWPTKGNWHDKFKITVNHGSYKFWFDIHSIGGLFSSLVLVICILTGLTWSFDWYKKSLYSALGSEVAKSSSHKTPADKFSAWNTAYRQIVEENLDKEIRMYQGEVDVVIGGVGNQQAYDTYIFDEITGAITTPNLYVDKKCANHIKGWIYTLHVGSLMGWASRIFYLICVIMGAVLPVSGYYLWLKRLCKKRK